MDTHAQIAVIGAGLAGKAAAVVAARSGFDTLHVAPASPEDRRTSALMLPSVEFMRLAGLIDDPESLGVPLSDIRIIDATDRLLRAPETLFRAQEFDLPAFGWNFANARLAAAFDSASEGLSKLSARSATLSGAERIDGRWKLNLSDGTQVTADLLVGADGKSSSVRQIAGIATREQKFAQSALVCDLKLERPVGNCSVEFHYANGPFTLVPAGGDRANLVWIDKADTLKVAKADADAFKAQLMEKSMRLFGRLEPLTGAFIFPLSTLSVDLAGKDGAVLVGESAHAFPPIGAQGLNLGLRDVETLLGALKVANPGAYGWAEAVARSYAHGRSGDLSRTGAFVDTLFRSLISEMLPAQALRTMGLWTLKTFPALRKHAIGFGMGR